MTRLTDEQIDREWDATDNPYRVRTFAHRIAALAVQEVEQECDRLRGELRGTLTSCTAYRVQLDAEHKPIATLTAQLATAKREAWNAGRNAIGAAVNPYPATPSGEGVKCADCKGSGVAAKYHGPRLECVTCEGTGEAATPSPEAREVCHEIHLVVEDGVARITPNLAKRIVELAFPMREVK